MAYYDFNFIFILTYVSSFFYFLLHQSGSSMGGDDSQPDSTMSSPEIGKHGIISKIRSSMRKKGARNNHDHDHGYFVLLSFSLNSWSLRWYRVYRSRDCSSCCLVVNHHLPWSYHSGVKENRKKNSHKLGWIWNWNRNRPFHSRKA